MNSSPEISIVVGIQDAHENLACLLETLLRTGSACTEILLCTARNQPVDVKFCAAPNVIIVEGREGALIPELWRDGILQATSKKVAILSAHCIPADGWLDIALSLDIKKCVAYGGPIVLHEDVDAVGAAIHLLRYSSVTPPQTAREMQNVAADNSVYNRDEIMACEDLLSLGFWEPSYHERFHQKGLKLAMHPNLVCMHVNQYDARGFMRQRRLHGRIYGRMRSDAMPLDRKFLMLALSPLIFFVYGSKLSISFLRNSSLRGKFPRAAPWLVAFLANWTWGEARGYADAIFERRVVPSQND